MFKLDLLQMPAEVGQVSGQSKPPRDPSLKPSSPHLECSPIFSHPLNKLKQGGCLHSVAVSLDLWLSTCGILLSAGSPKVVEQRESSREVLGFQSL